MLHGRLECVAAFGKDDRELDEMFPRNPYLAPIPSVLGSGTYIWKIPGFSRIMERKISSPSFQIAGCYWNLVAYPKGTRGDDSISVFVELNFSQREDDFTFLANLAFAVLDPTDPERAIVRETVAHHFSKNHLDVGFPSILKGDSELGLFLFVATIFRSLTPPARERREAFLRDDTLHVGFYLQAIPPTTCAAVGSAGQFTWKIQNFVNLKERLNSPSFSAGGCNWNIICYPRGKSGGSNMSLYLRIADTNLQPDRLYLASFRFSIINQTDGSKFSREVEVKNFKQNVEDWGFPQFIRLTMLFDEEQGFLASDSIIVEAFVELAQQPAFDQPVVIAALTQIQQLRVTPLHYAVFHLSLPGVAFLLDNGALQLPDTAACYPLDWAAYLGATEIVELLLARGGRAATADLEGSTPLHKAVAAGAQDAALRLLSAGADMNQPNSLGQTPLHLAFALQHWPLLAHFLAPGPPVPLRPNQQDADGRTLLHLAAYHGRDRLVRKLLKRGADVSIKDTDGCTALHKVPLSPAIPRNQAACVSLLLAAGAGPEPGPAGLTPLHYAAMYNALESMRLLLEAGHTPNCPDTGGRPPLFYAVSSGFLLAIKLLLLHQAELTSESSEALSQHPASLPNPLLQVSLQNADLPTVLHMLRQDVLLTSRSNILSFAASRGVGAMRPLPPSPSARLSRDLKALVNNEEFKDITFLVEHRPIYALKPLLSARSQYFRAMFSSSLREAVDPVIPMDGVEYPAFLALIEFLYTEQVPWAELQLKEKVSLLAVANQHIVEDLKSLCEAQLLPELSPATACWLFQQAELHEAHSLLTACVAFVVEHHTEIAEEELDDILPTKSFRTALLALLEEGNKG